MDFGTTIVGAVLILICILPIIFIIRSSKKGEKELLKVLNDLAAKNYCTIMQFDRLNYKIIGIDKEKFKLFFIRKNPDGFQEKVIDLVGIKKCQILSSNRSIKNKEGNYEVIEKVELAFTHKDKNRQKIILDYYNADYDSFMINGEFQFAEKWGKIINSILI